MRRSIARPIVAVLGVATLLGTALSAPALAASPAAASSLAAAAAAAVNPPTILTLLPSSGAITAGVKAQGGATVTLTALTSPGGASAGSVTVTAGPDGDAFPTLAGLGAGSFTINVTQTVGGVESAPATRGTVATSGVAGTGDYVPVGPLRRYDSRFDAAGPWTAGMTRSVPVAGHDGVPTSGVSAVAVAVSAVGPSSAGFLTVYPSGTARPLATALNFTAWQTKTNLVKVPLGADGSLSMYNHAGTTHVTVDIVGFYLSDTGGFLHQSSFQSVSPVRAYDSRPAYGGAGKLSGGATKDIVVTGAALGVPPTATAVEVQIEAIDPAAEGYLTVWPTGSVRPVVSNVLYLRSTTVTSGISAVGTSGSISVFTNVTTDIAVDICGYYDSAAGGKFHPLPPTRLYDSRDPSQYRMAGQETRAIQVANPNLSGFTSVVPAGATSAVFSATATDNSAATYLTFWPASQSLPTAAMLLPSGPGQLNDNLVVTWLGAGGPSNLATGAIAAYNLAGRTELVIDLNGYYTGESLPTATQTGMIGRVTSQTGVPVSGAVPYLFTAPGTDPIAHAVTDPSGLYVFPTAATSWIVCVDGTYADVYGYVGQCWQNQMWPTGEVNTGNTWLWVGQNALTQASFSLVAGGSLSGTVTAGGTPLSDVFVGVYDSNTIALYNNAFSASNGSFSVPGLPANTTLELCFLPYPYDPSVWPWKCYPQSLFVSQYTDRAGLYFDYASAPALGAATSPQSAQGTGQTQTVTGEAVPTFTNRLPARLPDRVRNRSAYGG